MIPLAFAKGIFFVGREINWDLKGRMFEKINIQKGLLTLCFAKC
jgi:hypothetical protein